MRSSDPSISSAVPTADAAPNLQFYTHAYNSVILLLSIFSRSSCPQLQATNNIFPQCNNNIGRRSFRGYCGCGTLNTSKRNVNERWNIGRTDDFEWKWERMRKRPSTTTHKLNSFAHPNHKKRRRRRKKGRRWKSLLLISGLVECKRERNRDEQQQQQERNGKKYIENIKLLMSSVAVGLSLSGLCSGRQCRHLIAFSFLLLFLHSEDLDIYIYIQIHIYAIGISKWVTPLIWRADDDGETHRRAMMTVDDEHNVNINNVLLKHTYPHLNVRNVTIRMNNVYWIWMWINNTLG